MKYIKNTQQKFLAYIIATLLLASITLAAIPPALSISGPALSASSGSIGDKITVSGTDAQPGSQINIFWENTNPLNMLATLYASGSGAYSADIPIPVAPAGIYYIIVQDFSGTAASMFTIVPAITLTPTQGIPNDSILISGTGFADRANIAINSGATPFTTIPQTITTDASGSFSGVFRVPNEPYGPYTIQVSDSTNTALATFTIGASITIDKQQGPSGSVVTLSGRGFASSADTDIAVTIDSSAIPKFLPIKTSAGGTFTGQIIIPTLAVGTYQISASDGNVVASTPFNVTTTSSITLSPNAGSPGIQTVRISGNGFTVRAGTIVTAQIGPLILGTYTTDATGAFTGTFLAPNLFPSVYTVTAKDANGLTASSQFQITLTALAVTPTTGATGTAITVTGFGFTGKTANITINNAVLSTIDVGSTSTPGTLLGGGTFVVPTLPVGTYTITATDNDGLVAQTVFSITSTSAVTLSPTSTSPDTTANVTARWFQPNSELTFTLRNATWHTAVNMAPMAGFSGTTTNAAGEYTGMFMVPLTWAFGSYTLNITGANGLTAEVPFTVSPMSITVNTRQSWYVQGETGTFIVVSESDTPGSITLTDPNGFTFGVLPVNLKKTGTAYTDPYITFRLPNDAPVGTWTWTADFTAHGGYTKTGSFTVLSTAPITNPSVTSSTPGGSVPAGSSGSTGSTEVANTTESQSSNSGTSSSTDSPNAIAANKPNAETDTNTVTQSELKASSSPVETAVKTPTATSSVAISIALAALAAVSLAGFAIFRLRYRGVKSSAVDQIMIRCQQLIKRLVADVANIKKLF
ncbi:MAG: hypothetical protein LBI79_04940 [Nitrososphaerota archaeon]|nr:hypothetical protein [Nitrososphaerota archaeon]